MTETDAAMPEKRGSVREIAVLRLFDAASRRGQRKMEREGRRNARQHEREAGKHADGSIDHARLLLAAGKEYLSGRKPREAVACLEVAEPGIESQKLQGTQMGFLGLACLYSALEVAYERTGQTEECEAVRAKEVRLAGEIEAHFGLHTEFHDDGTRIVSRVDTSQITPAPVAG